MSLVKTKTKHLNKSNKHECSFLILLHQHKWNSQAAVEVELAKTVIYKQLTATLSVILSLLCFDTFLVIREPPVATEASPLPHLPLIFLSSSSHHPKWLFCTPFPVGQTALLLNCLVMWPVPPQLNDSFNRLNHRHPKTDPLSRLRCQPHYSHYPKLNNV